MACYDELELQHEIGVLGAEIPGVTLQPPLLVVLLLLDLVPELD